MKSIISSKIIFLIVICLFMGHSIIASDLDSIKIQYYNSEGKAKLDALYSLIKVLRHDHLVEALTYEKEAEGLFKQINYPEAEAKILGQLAFCYINNAEFEKAFKLLQKSYNIALKLSDKTILAEIENNLGVANYFIGNYAIAAQYLMNAYKTRVKFGNKSDIANTANNLGLVFNQIMEFKKAKEYFVISLNLKKEVGDNLGTVRTISNICDTHIKLNEIKKAIKYFEEGFELSSKYKYESGIAIMANLGGRIYTILKDYERALHFYFLAKEIYHSRSERAGELQATNFIAEVYLITKNNSEAYKFLQNALSLKKDINQEAVFVKTYLLFSQYFEQQGNYLKALEFARIYDRIKDTIFDENKTRQIRELSASYEIENKQQQINLLNKEKIIRELDSERSLYVKYVLVLVLVVFFIVIVGLFYRNNVLLKNRKILEDLNTEILEQKNTLDELNKTKNTLFRIIAHDLRNPFNILIGFSDGLLSTWNNIEEREKIDLIKDINSVSKNSYLLLENLLDWAINNTEGKKVHPEKIVLQKFVKESICSLIINADKKNIKVNINIDENSIAYADHNMLNTVMRNIFSNAVKYTEYGGNIIIKSSFKDDKYVTLEIIDDGIGMSIDLIDKKLNQNNFETTSGTNNEKGTGLGLILCKELISKNNGILNISSENGKGTTVSILLPKI